MISSGINRASVHPTLSRRAFVGGAGATLLFAALPPSFRKALAATEFDLIVIGGGTAGMPAAICAAARGATVLLIDKAAQLGGTLYMSHGEMAAANTVFQSQRGIVDSPEKFYDDIMRINKHTSDPVLTRLWATHGGDAVNWLARNGFTLAEGLPVRGKSFDYFETARYLWGPEQGVSIYKIYEALLSGQIKSGRIKVLTGAGAVKLIDTPDGAVSGVVAEDDRGKRFDFTGRKVVISSGGCAANPTMYQDLHGTPLYSQFAYPYSQGAGLVLGLGAGGYLRGGENYISSFGSITADDRIPSPLVASLDVSSAERPLWEVFVNARGERFVQEDHPSIGHRARALDTQPGHRFWAIFDQRALERAPPIIPAWSRERFLQAFNDHPMFRRAPALTELGVRAGIDPGNLVRSVEQYNRAIKAREPDPFNRSTRPAPILEPPFFAIRSQGWTLKSFAGLAVDHQLQVITRQGRPVENLYAAGEVLGGGMTGGKAFTNGSNVTPALTFGRLLGQKILQF